MNCLDKMFSIHNNLRCNNRAICTTTTIKYYHTPAIISFRHMIHHLLLSNLVANIKHIISVEVNGQTFGNNNSQRTMQMSECVLKQTKQQLMQNPYNNRFHNKLLRILSLKLFIRQYKTDPYSKIFTTQNREEEKKP